MTSRFKFFPLLFLVVCVFAGAAQDVRACSCGPRPQCLMPMTSLTPSSSPALSRLEKVPESGVLLRRPRTHHHDGRRTRF